MKSWIIIFSMVLFSASLGCPAFATTPHTITIDGNTSDFASDELVWNDSDSDCAWDFNELYKMYITWDENALYIGADFMLEEANSLSFYMDFGLGDGAHDLGTVSWLKFFYTQGWLANFSANCSGNSTSGFFRIYADNTHDDWTSNPQIKYAINLTNGEYECKIPWSVIYPGNMPVNAAGDFVCTLTGYRGYDGADAMPQQDPEPNGDGNYDTLKNLYHLNFDANSDGTPESGWHPNTNSGAAGQPPFAKAEADPESGPAPLTVNFTGLGNDPDGGPVTYHWDFGDGDTSDDQNPSHIYTHQGSYTATLTVTDDEDVSTPDSVQIEVTGAAGAPSAEASADVTSGVAPLTVHFTGTGTDPEGGDVTYHWNFDDGTETDVQNPEHVFSDPGSYDVLLTVTDNESLQGTDTVKIVVAGGDDPYLSLYLSKESPSCFGTGDLFDIHADIINPGNSLTVDLYVLLAVYDYYYFWPAWSESLDSKEITISTDSTLTEDVLKFDWPANTGSGSGFFFYGAMFAPDTFDLIGNVEIREFCYN